ncbi:hypothetical protein MPSEU_000046400 [Mayamaea pseudoterrestris]|nr:hypothetical protein MPSEU_000046400 [Mayamaea pseudoterrestris]
MKTFRLLLLACLTILSSEALTPSSSSSQHYGKPALQQQQPQSRAAFFASTIASASSLLLLSLPVSAKSVDAKLAGTKKDPKFEGCLSQCMYECTKPKGAEQKSRMECLPECKRQCAVNKEQLMLGLPTEKKND